jgi:hypothetical protein
MQVMGTEVKLQIPWIVMTSDATDLPTHMVWVTLCRYRVVCGRIYPKVVNMPEDIFLERVSAFLLVSANFVSSLCFILYFALQSHLGLACQ